MGNQIQTAIQLRDRATQVALNFVGQTISSSDGTYELLIQLIHDELMEASKDAQNQTISLNHNHNAEATRSQNSARRERRQ